MNSYLDGIVEVADVFSSALTVANSAFNVLYIYPLKVLALPSMIPPDGLLVLRVGFKQSLAGPLSPLSYQSAALGGEATSKGF
ncbi:hypothetical protein, partial [Flavonifractor plautii]|uniref:hypothetical protein n=1 Tax=Flavonifractor plautii TaxID=292800 RepID=UPI003D7E93D8